MEQNPAVAMVDYEAMYHLTHAELAAERATRSMTTDNWLYAVEGLKEQIAKLRDELAAERAHADRLAEALRWSGSAMEKKGERRQALDAHDVRRSTQEQGR